MNPVRDVEECCIVRRYTEAIFDALSDRKKLRMGARSIRIWFTCSHTTCRRDYDHMEAVGREVEWLLQIPRK
jgi:hypothetical protein